MPLNTPPPAGTGQYPPPVYTQRAPKAVAPPASLLWWAGAMTVSGVLIGFGWWLLAPGGAFFGESSSPQTWLLRDLTLAGLELLAGVVVGWLLVLRLRLPGAWQRMCAAVGGSLAGSIVAVVLGQWLGMMFGADSTVPGADFVLRSLGAAVLWPAVASLVVFVASLVALSRTRRG